jgi:tetratricopeptide (TPR) repeat protein
MEKTSQGIFAPARGVAFKISPDTWQVGVDRLPGWFFPPEGRPVRPRCATCFSLDRGQARIALSVDSEETDSALVERLLRTAARDWRSRPALVQAADPGLVAVLAGLLAGLGVAVELRQDLRELREIQAATDRKAREGEGPAAPGLLTGAGVTLAQVEAFARAAVDFHAAAPWRLLGPMDLLHIEQPAGIDPALRHAVLLASRKVCTLTFFPDAAAWEAFRDDEDDENDENDEDDEEGEEGEDDEEGEAPSPQWILGLVPFWQLSATDEDLWERHGLPRSGEEERCPVPARVGAGETTRPDAGQLAFFEGLLRALAASTEDEMDRGRWEKDVPTHLGPLRFVLSLPDLLALLPGETDAGGQVRDLLDMAHHLGGRRGVLLARRALVLHPDSSEAYLELADAAPDPARALDLYDRARELAEQRLDALSKEEEEDDSENDAEDDAEDDSENDSENDEGLSFANVLRAWAGKAASLSALGRREEAVEHLLELVRLDPLDFTGEQDRLACLLLELGREDEAEVLIEDPGAEGLTGPPYNRALLAFRREGDSAGARRALRIARRINPLVPSALLPQAGFELPERTAHDAHYEDDGVDALIYADTAERTWRSTPGALTWLAQRMEDTDLGAQRGGKKNRGKRPRKKKKKRR